MHRRVSNSLNSCSTQPFCWRMGALILNVHPPKYMNSTSMYLGCHNQRAHTVHGLPIISSHKNTQQLKVTPRSLWEISDKGPLMCEDNQPSGVCFGPLTEPLRRPTLSSEQKVQDVVRKQAAMANSETKNHNFLDRPSELFPGSSAELMLGEAYERCREICEEYAKTFYIGTLLMTPERQRAVWAIYVWCRRTDELVDGAYAPCITPAELDQWEQRLEGIFQGRPYDMLDAALSDAISKFGIDIQPFRDMIEGMRMDLRKSRYQNFDELYLYCYNVAGTVGLMSVPVMGIAPHSNAATESVYHAALSLGIADQLTNILRDVGEDASRGRIYLPQDELALFGLSDQDIFAGRVTDRWRAFMREQIRRARFYFHVAEKGVVELDNDSRWPVWASLMLYRQILDAIEVNDYNNFTKRAYVGKMKKFLALPLAYVESLVQPPPTPKLA